MDPPPTGKRGLFGWSNLLRYKSILGRGWNLQNYIGICWNSPDMYQIELDMLRFGRISTRSGQISTRSRQISKRSGHFSTNRTKTTGETLPLMENDYFSDVIQSGQFFFGFSCLDQPTDLLVSSSGGGDPPSTYHLRRVRWFSDQINQVGRVG